MWSRLTGAQSVTRMTAAPVCTEGPSRRWPHILLREPRLFGGALLAFGTLVLLVSYVAICLHTGSIWPWRTIVHEDGERTLLGTVLFYEHAARELPLDLLLGVMIGASALLATAPGRRSGPGRAAAGPPATGLSLLLAAVVAVIVLGTAAEVGPAALADNLLQKPTRSGAPLMMGAHWHYHLLSRLALLLVSFGFAGVFRWCSGAGPDARDRAGLRGVAAALATFLVLTIVFTPDPSMLHPPFTEPRHLGHQAREVLTHGLMTLPIAFGCCLLLGGRRSPATPDPTAGQAGGPIVRAWMPAAIALGALGIIIGAWLGLAAIASDAAAHGQTADLASLVFAHVFEHTFTYIVVILVALLVMRCARPS